MLGYIKNFEMKAREDGGYDCSTSIISMGEILESIKGKRNFPPFKMGEDDESKGRCTGLRYVTQSSTACPELGSL